MPESQKHLNLVRKIKNHINLNFSNSKQLLVLSDTPESLNNLPQKINNEFRPDVFAEDKLFATLDTTVRKVNIKSIPFLMSDTVGFIRKLPHQLIESFKSTLDEIREADVLVHVVDVSHRAFEEQYEVVNETLNDITKSQKIIILVFNKIDNLTKTENSISDLVELKRSWMSKMNTKSVFISATKKKNIELSISCTTRPKRSKEIHGVDYYFIKEEKFKNLYKKNYFIETAKVFDNLYGSPYVNIKKSFKKNKHILFDIDWQGARKLRNNFPANQIIDFFILPPNKKELKRRLEKRGRDNKKEISIRLSHAIKEINHYTDYKYVLINENINETVNNLLNIINHDILISSIEYQVNKKLKFIK